MPSADTYSYIPDLHCDIPLAYLTQVESHSWYHILRPLIGADHIDQAEMSVSHIAVRTHEVLPLAWRRQLFHSPRLT